VFRAITGRAQNHTGTRARRPASLIGVCAALALNVAWSADTVSAEPDTYRVDAETADIRILVRPAGALARMGHSHVIAVAELEGTIFVYPDDQPSHFDLLIPVQALIVDDPVLRQEEGGKFSKKLSTRGVAGTRKNMLGKRVLNAKEYPEIKLTGTVHSDDGTKLLLDLSIELLGRVVEMQIPTTLGLDGDTLEVSGTFQLSHDALGMRPFSTALGTLGVADVMDVKYHIRAQRTQTAD